MTQEVTERLEEIRRQAQEVDRARASQEATVEHLGKQAAAWLKMLHDEFGVSTVEEAEALLASEQKLLEEQVERLSSVLMEGK